MFEHIPTIDGIMAVVVSVGMRSSLESAGGIFDAPALAVKEKDLRS